ncbi:metalloprotease [Taibaiella sp. KBW10]|uniref:KPN_02809 family neutral zinc metallopeptidase n=1 Tax=Taibaiella sp. KBW10 TaxID=2153357 RepID=UPI000F59E257|nr:neutral zinc metallopeptidase [Taibaiella sp. KBW10]RQO31382.1 metalloprotease [Taibaiella sp. KBW10]
MRWRGERESDNVEDSRGMSGGGKLAIGGGLGTIIIVVVGLLMGKSPTNILGDVMNNKAQQSSGYEQTTTVDPNDSTTKMVRVILASTEDVWSDVFNQAGATYQKPKLRIFSGSEETACGQGSRAMGPFYCPADAKVYIDLSFCEELRTKFKAPGNFAVAYVIAHEVGHHIQNLMGTSEKVQQLRGRLSEAQYNKYSVALELQADFYAGVWANRAQKMRNILEPGDLETALTAANAIGDDKLQSEAQGYVVPDAFTHGTSQQRMYWFKRGYQTGDLNQGNTFKELGLAN